MGGQLRRGDLPGAAPPRRAAAGPAAPDLPGGRRRQRDRLDDHLRRRLAAVARPDGLVPRPLPRAWRRSDRSRASRRSRRTTSSGLAPAVVATAGFDPLVDQGEAYAEAAERGRDAGRLSLLRQPLRTALRPSPASSRRPTSPAGRSPVWCARRSAKGTRCADAGAGGRGAGAGLRRLRAEGDSDARSGAWRGAGQGARRGGQLPRPAADPRRIPAQAAAAVHPGPGDGRRVVAKVGEGVDRWKVGDAVVGGARIGGFSDDGADLRARPAPQARALSASARRPASARPTSPPTSRWSAAPRSSLANGCWCTARPAASGLAVRRSRQGAGLPGDRRLGLGRQAGGDRRTSTRRTPW